MPREGQQLSCKCRSSVGGRDHFLDVVQQQIVPGELVPHEARETGDGREKVVEVVSDPTCEPTNRLQLLGLPQLLTLLSQPRTQGNRLAHVAYGGAQQQTLLCTDGRETDLRAELAAIPTAGKEGLSTLAHGPMARVVRKCFDVAHVRRPEARWHQHLDRLANQLSRLVAEELLGHAVDQLDNTFGVRDDDGIWSAFEEHSEGSPRLVLDHDVAHAAQDHVARGRLEKAHAHRGWKLASVLAEAVRGCPVNGGLIP